MRKNKSYPKGGKYVPGREITRAKFWRGNRKREERERVVAHSRKRMKLIFQKLKPRDRER